MLSRNRMFSRSGNDHFATLYSAQRSVMERTLPDGIVTYPPPYRRTRQPIAFREGTLENQAKSARKIGIEPTFP